MSSNQIDDVFVFLEYAEKKGFLNKNTAQSRKTAFKKLADILDNEQKSVTYMQQNLETIKARFMNLNREVNGSTVDEYIRRANLVLQDYSAWSEDRSKWEKDIAGRNTRESRSAKAEKKQKQKIVTEEQQSEKNDSEANSDQIRMISFPIGGGREFKVSIPDDLITLEELQKIGLFLLPYCKDFSDFKSPKIRFPAIPMD